MFIIGRTYTLVRSTEVLIGTSKWVELRCWSLLNLIILVDDFFGKLLRISALDAGKSMDK